MSEHDPTQSPPPPDDRELEAFLSRQSPLSQAYREAQPPERVPDNVDAAVRAWARREHDQHLGRRGRWWDRAALPVGAAASLILVALLVNKGRESGVSEREAMHAATAGASVSAARSVQAPVAENTKPSPAEPLPASPPSPEQKVTTTAAAGRDLKSVAPRSPSSPQLVSAQAPPPPEAPVSSAPAAAPAAPESPAAENDALTEARQPVAAADRSAAEPGVANAPAQRAAGMLSSSGSRAMKTEAAPPPPAAAPVMASPAPAPFPAMQAAAKAAPSRMLAGDNQLRSCDQAESGAVLDSRSYPPAESWLAGIRSLRDTTQLELAQRQMRCWQRVYPQAAVPDDLKDLLSPP